MLDHFLTIYKAFSSRLMIVGSLLLVISRHSSALSTLSLTLTRSYSTGCKSCRATTSYSNPILHERCIRRFTSSLSRSDRVDRGGNKTLSCRRSQRSEHRTFHHVCSIDGRIDRSSRKGGNDPILPRSSRSYTLLFRRIPRQAVPWWRFTHSSYYCRSSHAQ